MSSEPAGTASVGSPGQADAAVVAAGPGRGRRAVLLVANTAAPYSRGLRVARSLAEAGWDVEIAAVAGPDVPDEERDGPILTRRYRPSGPFRRWIDQPPPPNVPIARLRPLVRRVDRAVKAAFWPIHVRAWWRTLRREAPIADVYHAFGILTLPMALWLARRAQRAGREGLVIYDVIDAILDSNNYTRTPRPLLASFRRREASWVRRADAVITVNDAIADHCHRIWPFRSRPAVVMNCQPLSATCVVPGNQIRAAAGVPNDVRVVLFVGRLGRHRGLEAAMQAISRVDRSILVLLGFPVNAEWAQRLADIVSDPTLSARVRVLPPVEPDEVTAWAASADISLITVPATSFNQRASTPNKFWESLSAGTPVVVGQDLEVMRGIVERHQLGSTADPSDPEDIAAAIRCVLDLPPQELAAMRARCQSVMRERYTWESQADALLAVYQSLHAR